MNQYQNINSDLDALRIKEVEKIFYENLNLRGKIIPKVTPFKGINVDLMYLNDSRLLFIKFMDTTEDLFSILDNELLEVMYEESQLLKSNVDKIKLDIKCRYIFVMPYVEIEDKCGFDEFVDNDIIDKTKLNLLLENKGMIDKYLSDYNDEVSLNLFMSKICPEYYVVNKNPNYINNEFKKISYKNDDYNYTLSFLDEKQIIKLNSIKYNNGIVLGPSGSSKTTLMLARAIKLSRIYPHHNFIVFTYSKQLCNDLREKLDILYKENENIEIHTFKSFLFKLAKKYNLVIDYNNLKKDQDKVYRNLMMQAKNTIKTKNVFKGIFVDEIENFSLEEINFIREFLYKTKHIFNIYLCKSQNIYNSASIFKNHWYDIGFSEGMLLKDNYRQNKELVQFVNNFNENAYSYIKGLRDEFGEDYYIKSNPIREDDNSVNIIKVADFEEQISSVMWEVEYLVSKKGLKYSDIVIIYPFNKKKLKSGKTIYFQYMLKKALEENNIPYMYCDEDITNMTNKSGVTISNIYSIRNLEYKAVIMCQLEMLYNHTIHDTKQDYQINDFVGDLNKVYLGINRASDYLSIITTFNEESSDIIKILFTSK